VIESSATPTQLRLRSRPVVITTVMVMLLVILITLLPNAISFGLQWWLRNHGAPESEITNVDFNPFTGVLLIEQIRGIDSSDTSATIGQIQLQIRWRDLFSHQLHLQQVSLSGLHSPIVIGSDGTLAIGSIKLPASDEPASPNRWDAQFDRITIDNSTVRIETHGIETTATIDHAAISQLTTTTNSAAATLLFKGKINSSEISFNGESTPFATQPAVSGKLTLDAIDISAISPLLQASSIGLGGRLSLDTNFTLQNTGGLITATHEGAITTTQLLLHSGELNANAERLQHTGRAELKLSPKQGRSELLLAGELNSQQFKGQLGNGTTASYATLQLSGDQQFTLDTTLSSIRFEQRIKIKAPHYTANGLISRAEQLEWHGKGLVTLADDKLIQLQASNGRLDAKRIELTLPDNDLQMQLTTLGWRGNIDSHAKDKAARLSGNFILTGIDALAPHRGVRYLQGEQLTVSNLKLGGEKHLWADEIKLAQPRLLSALSDENTPPALHAAAFTLGGVELKLGESVDVETTDINSMTADILRNQDGSLRLVTHLNPKDKGETSQSETSTLTVRLGRFSLSGENRIHFTDHSVTPHYHNSLNIEHLTLSEIDSRKPEQATSLSFKGTIGKLTPLALNGTFHPFHERPSLALKGEIKSLDLPPLSPYTVRQLGYELSSGHADLDIDFVINHGKLQGKNTLRLNNLTVVVADNEKMENLSSQLTMPLDSALSLLRDNDNDIKLSLPISGDIDNPQFSLADAVNQALGTVMKKSVITYLKYSFQPYGTLIAIAELANAAASYIRLDPIAFAPSLATLDAEAKRYLEKVGTLMQERNKLRIRLCGKATTIDLANGDSKQHDKRSKEEPSRPLKLTDEKQQELILLARRRAETVRDHLVEYYAIKADRLFICQPKLELDEALQPRVELEI